MALPKPNRLKKRNDFQKVFRDGRGAREGFLFLRALKNGTKTSRFGLIVTKKASKKAVVRNRIKRAVSEALKENLVRIKSGWDAILIVSQPLSQKDLAEIKEKTARLLQRVKLTPQ